MNEYGFGHFKLTKDRNEEELLSANADTLKEIGKRYEKEIVDGDSVPMMWMILITSIITHG